MSGAYRASEERRGGARVVTLAGPGGARAEIAPELGNNCFAFSMGGPILEPVDFGDFLGRPGSCGIPILFPFPNRIAGGRFRFGGEEFRVDPARHGFVRDKAWRVEQIGADAESAWLISSLRAADCGDALLGQFPFPFRIEVRYRLAGPALEMGIAITNDGERGMPWGFGIHPYFTKPAQGALRVPAAERWELRELLPTGRRLPVAGDFDLRGGASLEGLALDDVYTSLAGPLATCTLLDFARERAVDLRFRHEDFPNVVVFTPPPPRAAICIEPQTCPTDAFNLAARGVPGAGMRVLAPGGSARLSLAIVSRPL